MRLVLRSTLLLFTLYGILFALGDLYLAHRGAPVWIAVLFSLGLVLLQYLASPWLIDFLTEIVWDKDFDALPTANREFLQQLCAKRGLKVPRIGVIYSGTPNAFSFGRLRADARIVVTKGLLDILSVEETNAVLAHELGHIEHYDFLVMTVAYLVPLLLYQIYCFASRINNTRALGFGAYLCYWISQYMVLLLNRTREFFADQYASEVTNRPDALSSALVKISYGLVRADGEHRKALEFGSNDEKELQGRQHRLAGTIAVMGICNVRSGAALALGDAGPEEASAVLRWDLVNPWARIYELNSTHPLTALRVRELNTASEARGQPISYALPNDRRVRWGRFPLELLIWAAPWICAALIPMQIVLERNQAWLHIALPDKWVPSMLIGIGVSWLVRIAYRYRGIPVESQVTSLLQDLDASEMQPRAVRLRGEIVGRGVPGVFWSSDLVLRDATGLIFLQYRQFIPFARFLFGVRKADQYICHQVEVEGWFRRGLTPYVEMSFVSDGTSTSRSYSRWVQSILAISALAAGLALMILSG